MSKLGRIDISKSMSNGTHEIWNYIDAGTLTEVDYSLQDEYLSRMYTEESPASCTTSATINEFGDVIIGRNLDVPISYSPIFGFYMDTKEPGTYRSFNLAYSYMASPTVDQVMASGEAVIPDDFKKFLPLWPTDAMNVEGLFMEVNMRDSDFDEDGNYIFANNGTNPDAEQTIYTWFLGRYLIDHCATIDEALEVVKTINIKDAVLGDGLVYNLTFMMGDATGKYGVLEIAQDEIIFTEGAHCQSNFYIADKFLNQASYFDGLGRYTRVMQGIGDARNLDDLNELMQKVRYSTIFNDNNTEWDNICDFCSYFDKSAIWMLVHKYDEDVKAKRHALMHRFDGQSYEEIAESKMKWYTVYRTLVNCKTRQIAVVCNEDLEQRILINL